MKLEIVNNKKLNWNHVNKAMVKLTAETLNYEAPLRVSEIAELHFVTGQLLQEFYTK